MIRRAWSRSSETRTPRVYVDHDTDAARVVVSDRRVARTVRAEGIGFVDLDDDGNIVALELFGVSKQIAALREGDLEAAAPERPLDEELRAAATRLVDEARERVS